MANEEVNKTIDLRHKSYDELPQSMGENPSEEVLKSWFSNYGWVNICEVQNKSGNKITFYNPYRDDARGDIAPGKTESQNSKGDLPLESYSKRYTITYFNTAFGVWKTLSIKDLDHDWLISFEQDGVDQDIREFRPYTLGEPYANISLIVYDTGYRIYGCDFKADLSRLRFTQP